MTPPPTYQPRVAKRGFVFNFTHPWIEASNLTTVETELWVFNEMPETK